MNGRGIQDSLTSIATSGNVGTAAGETLPTLPSLVISRPSSSPHPRRMEERQLPSCSRRRRRRRRRRRDAVGLFIPTSDSIAVPRRPELEMDARIAVVIVIVVARARAYM